MKLSTIILLFILLPLVSFSQDQVKIDSLTNELKRSSNDSVKTQLYLTLSGLYQSNDFYKSLEFARKALKEAEQAKEPALQARANNKIGIILFHIGQYDGSLDYFIRGRKIYEQIGDSSRLIGQMNNICNVYLQMKEYDKAWDLFNSIIERQQNLLAKGDSSNMPQLHVFYNSMGNISQKVGKNELAEAYYLKALNNAIKYGFDKSLGSIYNNLGAYNFEKGNNDDALRYLNLAIENSKKLNDKIQLSESYLFLSKFYFEQRDMEKAIKIANEGLSEATEIGSIEYMEKTSLEIYKIQKELGHFKEALEAHVNYHNYHDSLFNEQLIKETTRLGLKYEFDKKEEINKEEQRRTQLRYIIIIIVLVFAIILIGLLFWLNKSRTKSAFFARQSLEKDLELRQRELVMKEIYLLEKNESMAKVISSLSDLKNEVRESTQTVLTQVIKEVEASINKTVWEDFEIRYQQVHEGFYTKLREQFPDLSAGEEKLAALLRLGMSSKEIADITHQSVKSVEVSRSRLRKRLNLTNTNANLTTFLAEF